MSDLRSTGAVKLTVSTEGEDGEALKVSLDLPKVDNPRTLEEMVERALDTGKSTDVIHENCVRINLEIDFLDRDGGSTT